MKLVTAIVRPDKLDDLVGALTEGGAQGLTVTETRGFGRQYGQIATGLSRTGGTSAAARPAPVLLGKIRLESSSSTTTPKPSSRSSTRARTPGSSATGKSG